VKAKVPPTARALWSSAWVHSVMSEPLNGSRHKNPHTQSGSKKSALKSPTRPVLIDPPKFQEGTLSFLTVTKPKPLCT
jgi:hypothetical protein